MYILIFNVHADVVSITIRCKYIYEVPNCDFDFYSFCPPVTKAQCSLNSKYLKCVLLGCGFVKQKYLNACSEDMKKLASLHSDKKTRQIPFGKHQGHCFYSVTSNNCI